MPRPITETAIPLLMCLFVAVVGYSTTRLAARGSR